MLLNIAIIAGIIAFFVMPLMVLHKYYTMHDHSLLANGFWIIAGIITWPLIPIYIAFRKKDAFLKHLFWGSFFVWAISFGFWMSHNLEEMLRLQAEYVKHL